MKRMRARFAGTCAGGCGVRVQAGDLIRWSKESGAIHDNGACPDAYWGNEFGRHEAAQERAAFQAEHDWESEMIAREEREYQQGYHEVAAIQAISAPGSAFREQLYAEMEQRDYDLYG